MGKKLLIIIFIILIFVTVSETAYYSYLFLFNQNKSGGDTNNTKQTAPLPTPSPTPIVNFIIPANSVAVNPANVNPIINYKKGILNSATVNYIFSGTILDIDTTSDLLVRHDINPDILYKAIINLQGENKVQQKLYFSVEDFSKAAIVQITNGKEEPIKLEDLKINDKIKIEQITDLMAARKLNTLKLSITKL